MPRNRTQKIRALEHRLAREIRERDEEICRLYAAYLADPITGWTLEKIGERYGLSKQRVGMIWKKYNPD